MLHKTPEIFIMTKWVLSVLGAPFLLGQMLCQVTVAGRSLDGLPDSMAWVLRSSKNI